MWGLEYALLFGAPENKLELFDGRTPLSCPFPDRETAEAHFALWIETLYRWQGWLTDTSCGSQTGESRGPFNPDRHYPPRPGKRHWGRIRAGAQPKQAPDREFEVESPAQPAPADLEVA